MRNQIQTDWQDAWGYYRFQLITKRPSFDEISDTLSQSHTSTGGSPAWTEDQLSQLAAYVEDNAAHISLKTLEIREDSGDAKTTIYFVFNRKDRTLLAIETLIWSV